MNDKEVLSYFSKSVAWENIGSLNEKYSRYGVDCEALMSDLLKQMIKMTKEEKSQIQISKNMGLLIERRLEDK